MVGGGGGADVDESRGSTRANAVERGLTEVEREM